MHTHKILHPHAPPPPPPPPPQHTHTHCSKNFDRNRVYIFRKWLLTSFRLQCPKPSTRWKSSSKTHPQSSVPHGISTTDWNVLVFHSQPCRTDSPVCSGLSCFSHSSLQTNFLVSHGGYIYIYIQRERERQRESITKVQACLGLKPFTPNFRPSWGLFKACPVGQTDSYIY